MDTRRWGFWYGCNGSGFGARDYPVAYTADDVLADLRRRTVVPIWEVRPLESREVSE
jgi:hypothetical protein